jgi:hypothetical protein
MPNTNSELIKSIGSNSLDILSDYGEIAVDATIESGVLKDIPIFGSLIKFSKIGLTIKDYLFVNKLKSFLLSVNKISAKERIEFIESNFSDKSKASDLGEKLINTLDKIDSTNKAFLVGKSFNLYLLNKIDRIEFYDLIYTIENFKLHYSEIFIETCLSIENSNTKDEIIDHFFTCGLLYSKNKQKLLIYNENEPRYSNDRLTDLGKLFLEDILEYDKDELLQKFRNKILNINYNNSTKPEWVFIEKIKKSKLQTLLESETLNSILNYRVYSSFVSNYRNKTNNIITRNSEDDFTIYKRIEKKEPKQG